MSSYPYHAFSPRDIAEAARCQILASLGYRTSNPHPLASVESAPEDLSLAGTAQILGHKVLKAANSRDIGRRSAEIRAGLATADFQQLLNDLTRDLLQRSFEPNIGHRRLFQQITATDFRPFAVGDLEGAGDNFGPLGERGEYTSSAVTASGEQMQLSRFGKIISVTPELVIDDAVGLLERLIADAAQSAARFEERTAFDVIVNPSTLADGQAFYDATNTVQITALSVVEVGKAFAKLRNQSVSGHPFNLAPTAVLVSPANELPFGATMVLAGKTVDIHVSSAVADADLYFVAGPRQHASFGLSFLAGTSGTPLVARERQNIRSDGARFRISHDFDVAPLSRTGVVKATISGGE